MNNQIKKLDLLLSKTKGDLLNITWSVYQIICEDKEHSADVLEYFLSKYDRLDSSEEIEIPFKISVEEKQELKKKYGKLTDAIIENLQSENLPEHDFYEHLWNRGINSDYFSVEEAKVFALYYIWIDKRIPYYQVGVGKKMSNEEYHTRSNSINDFFLRIKFILNSESFTQKTERASLVLDEIQKVADRDDQIVLMSRLLSELQKSRFPPIETLLPNLSEQ